MITVTFSWYGFAILVYYQCASLPFSHPGQGECWFLWIADSASKERIYFMLPMPETTRSNTRLMVLGTKTFPSSKLSTEMYRISPHEALEGLSVTQWWVLSALNALGVFTAWLRSSLALTDIAGTGALGLYRPVKKVSIGSAKMDEEDLHPTATTPTYGVSRGSCWRKHPNDHYICRAGLLSRLSWARVMANMAIKQKYP